VLAIRHAGFSPAWSLSGPGSSFRGTPHAHIIRAASDGVKFDLTPDGRQAASMAYATRPRSLRPPLPHLYAPGRWRLVPYGSCRKPLPAAWARWERRAAKRRRTSPPHPTAPRDSTSPPPRVVVTSLAASAPMKEGPRTAVTHGQKMKIGGGWGPRIGNRPSAVWPCSPSRWCCLGKTCGPPCGLRAAATRYAVEFMAAGQPTW